MVENLLINAIRHGLPYDRKDSDSDIPIFLYVEYSTKKNLIIGVEDRGEGISKVERKHIFEPFVRGEKAKERQHPGSGLGLHLVRRIPTMLDGRIFVESPYQDRSGLIRTGCRFTAEIPYYSSE